MNGTELFVVSLDVSFKIATNCLRFGDSGLIRDNNLLLNTRPKSPQGPSSANLCLFSSRVDIGEEIPVSPDGESSLILFFFGVLDFLWILKFDLTERTPPEDQSSVRKAIEVGLRFAVMFYFTRLLTIIEDDEKGDISSTRDINIAIMPPNNATEDLTDEDSGEEDDVQYLQSIYQVHNRQLK
ncbi:hypothetical protein C0J52_20534 [Blattella germanica]|nr:hypothetical protein C0J52_20534 [Blattella germanica]